MKITNALFIAATLFLTACNFNNTAKNNLYHDTAGRTDILSGGIQLIPIQTAKGNFNVWTKRVGNNPTTKVLLLHGGPGATHEYFECFDSFFPQEGFEYYYYDFGGLSKS